MTPNEILEPIFAEALERVITKGQARHGTDVDFLQQPIFTIPKNLTGSNDPLLFQAVKKIYESVRNDVDTRSELLDAIVYLACAVYRLNTARV